MKSMIIGDHNSENQSRNSIQEVEPHEQDIGPLGRSYECIFCKRGFPTAQALGGHMNIHRKDRAKTRPKEEDHSLPSRPRFYQPVFSRYPQAYTSENLEDQEGNTRYKTYFSSTSSTLQQMNQENGNLDVYRAIRSPSRDEKMMSLSLQYGWSHDSASHGAWSSDVGWSRSSGDGKEDELDLELRLGHDP